jgi:aryl-alcohol dehydrogenase-like predicted oxidoreductase
MQRRPTLHQADRPYGACLRIIHGVQAFCAIGSASFRGGHSRGVLAGKYSNATKPETPRDEDLAHWFLRPQDLEIAGRVVELANQKKASPAQIALAWMLSKDEITAPIVGVTKLEQLENIVAATEIKLLHDEIAYLEALYRPRELIGRYAGIAMPGDLQ